VDVRFSLVFVKILQCIPSQDIGIFEALNKPLFFKFAQVAFCDEFGKLGEFFGKTVKPLDPSNAVVLLALP
jgi:hypothetical protein